MFSSPPAVIYEYPATISIITQITAAAPIAQPTFCANTAAEKHKPVVEHLEWDEQIGDIFYVENGEDYYDENGVLNKDLFKDNEDLFI